MYQKLAKKYKKDESLLIAKFDATANDAPADFQFSGEQSTSVILKLLSVYSVQGFPPYS